MKQLTRKEAIALAETGWWETATPAFIAAFQLVQVNLCCPFEVFHEALEKALGRPVMAHELGLNWEGLVAELAGLQKAPTIDEVIAMIPEHKRIVILTERYDE
ncbi:MAG: hypothetical protein PHQ40_17275 [Anaerolineaceae bacterium]|nr:hypothetical protein [Anaerolineaceae bacterium]